jgi:hypothetical protein
MQQYCALNATTVLFSRYLDLRIKKKKSQLIEF